jgi:hypothetical protein
MTGQPNSPSEFRSFWGRAGTNNFGEYVPSLKRKYTFVAHANGPRSCSNSMESAKSRSTTMFFRNQGRR